MLRYDAYFNAPMKVGVQHFGKPYSAEIVQDEWYTFAPIFKESLLSSVEVTTNENLTSGVLKFAILRRGMPALTGFFIDKSIATALDAAALGFHAGFTAFKPSMFTLGDALENTATLSLNDDYNLISLGFQLTGAAPTDTLTISFRYLQGYRA